MDHWETPPTLPPVLMEACKYSFIILSDLWFVFSIVLALLLSLYQDRLFTHIIQYNLANEIYSAIILHYQRSHFEMYKVNSTQMKLYHIFTHGVYK